MIDLVGTPPIPRPLFIGAKLSMLACWLFSLVKLMDGNLMLYDGPVNRGVAAVLFCVGILVLGCGLRALGKSTRIGLPEDNTELKTGGIYRISRNPVYLGAYFLCLASCSFSLHVINLMLAAFAVGAHHRIVLAEERFLESKFGEEWRRYKAAVRRYL